MSQLEKIEFHLGKFGEVLEVPPFYVNFQKRSFRSVMGRKNLPIEGVAIYIYVTRHRHVEKLLVLKRMYPDLYVPEEQRELVYPVNELSQKEFEEFVKFLGIEEFVKSVREVEEEWKYVGGGIWSKSIGPFKIYMILIIGNARWTVRPAISSRRMKGYGFELPVDTKLSEEFMKELKEGELEEIHDH
ncbi:MAG: hypothetical protein QXF26_06325, partial [Candidatus Bathyarchaeia archaeon]